MTNSPKRKTTIRNLPILFLVEGVFFAVAAIAMPLANNAYTAKENDLQTISGIVQRAPYITGPGRGGDMLQIFVRGSNGLHHLTQNDMSGWVPGIMDPIMNLRVGDNVTARVKHVPLGGDFDWLWEMQRNGTVILSYQNTHLYYAHADKRRRLFSYWAAGLAVALLLGAILLRRRFGAWSDTRKLA